MKHMNESERILSVFGALLTMGALVLSVGTELSARNHRADYRRRVAAAPVVQQGAPATYDRHIGFEQQTLASRWSIPDGHATLGAGFGIFGIILVAVPLAAAKRRVGTA